MDAAGEVRAVIARAFVDRLVGRRSVHHVALGTFCHIAAALRDAGLRRWTGPFDWIFSTPAMIEACLADGFAAFLDPANLSSVPPAELAHGAKRQGHHRLYEGRYGLPTLFNHHDPAASTTDMRSLERAATRLAGALGPGHANVFYMMSEVRWPADEIAALATRLAGCPARNALAIVTLEGGAPMQDWSVRERAIGACRVMDVDVRTLSRSSGVAFPDPADAPFFARVLLDVAARADPSRPGVAKVDLKAGAA